MTTTSAVPDGTMQTFTVALPHTLDCPRVTSDGRVSPLEDLPDAAIRRDASVLDIEFWQTMPEAVRALAYRVLQIEGIGS